MRFRPLYGFYRETEVHLGSRGRPTKPDLRGTLDERNTPLQVNRNISHHNFQPRLFPVYIDGGASRNTGFQYQPTAAFIAARTGRAARHVPPTNDRYAPHTMLFWDSKRGEWRHLNQSRTRNIALETSPQPWFGVELDEGRPASSCDPLSLLTSLWQALLGTGLRHLTPSIAE